MDNKQIKIKINEGFLHIRSIVEVVGTPKDYVEESLKGYIKKIESNADLIVVKKTFHQAEENDDKLFVTFYELDLLVKDSMALLSFCFDYMPASVEIVEPSRIIFNSFDLTSFINDMQARLHSVNIGISNYKTRNENLIVNTAILMKNFVSHLAKTPITLKEIAVITGIKPAEAENLLNALIKENVIVKKGDKYHKK